jgi:hypothetical protein
VSLPSIEQLAERALDVTAPEYVEIEVDMTRSVIYVHVEGVTLLRCCRVKTMKVIWNAKL